MNRMYKITAILTACLLAACATQLTEREMNYLASALTKVSAAVDVTVRYRRSTESLPETELLQLSMAHDPALMRPFSSLTVRVLRDGQDSAILVCEPRTGKALLEDAGCTAQLDQHNWAGPHQVLVVFPNEPLDFDPVAMTTDHIEGRPVEERTRFMAIMVGDPTNMPLFAQHFALVPNDLKIRLFLEVEQARAWLAQEARMAFPN